MGEIIAGICVLCHRSGHNVTSAISKALSNLITAHAAKRSGAAERHPGLARPAPCLVAGAGVCGPDEVRPGIAESVSIRFPARESAIPGPSRHAESVNQGSAGRRNQLSRITGNRYWRVKQLCLIGIDAGQWRCVARGRRRPSDRRRARSRAASPHARRGRAAGRDRAVDAGLAGSQRRTRSPAARPPPDAALPGAHRGQPADRRRVRRSDRRQPRPRQRPGLRGRGVRGVACLAVDAGRFRRGAPSPTAGGRAALDARRGRGGAGVSVRGPPPLRVPAR